MAVTQEIIRGLLILLPGFVTAGIIRALFVGDVENDFDKVVRSLIYAFVDYVLFTLYTWLWRRPSGSPPAIDVLAALPSQPGDILALGLISVSVGCVVAFYKTNDGHQWVLRRLNITRRTTRHSVWHDAFIDFGKGYIIVNFRDSRRLYGWPLHYNDDANQPYLFLTRAEWLVDDAGEQHRVPAGRGGILLLPDAEIDNIEFIGVPEQDVVT